MRVDWRAAIGHLVKHCLPDDKPVGNVEPLYGYAFTAPVDPYRLDAVVSFNRPRN